MGINLTEANHVFLLEPLLNPGLEKQAIGRVHRMGQRRSVTVTKFAMKDSIESRILVHASGGGAAASAATATTEAGAAAVAAAPGVPAGLPAAVAPVAAASGIVAAPAKAKVAALRQVMTNIHVLDEETGDS